MSSQKVLHVQARDSDTGNESSIPAQAGAHISTAGMLSLVSEPAKLAALPSSSQPSNDPEEGIESASGALPSSEVALGIPKAMFPAVKPSQFYLPPSAAEDLTAEVMQQSLSEALDDMLWTTAQPSAGAPRH